LTSALLLFVWHDTTRALHSFPTRRSSDLPANGPAAIIAARRYVKYPEESHGGFNNLEWAQRIYDWMKYNRTILSSGRVFEHLDRSEEHTSELQSRENLVCRLLLEKKKKME